MLRLQTVEFVIFALLFWASVHLACTQFEYILERWASGAHCIKTKKCCVQS